VLKGLFHYLFFFFLLLFHKKILPLFYFSRENLNFLCSDDVGSVYQHPVPPLVTAIPYTTQTPFPPNYHVVKTDILVDTNRFVCLELHLGENENETENKNSQNETCPLFRIFIQIGSLPLKLFFFKKNTTYFSFLFRLYI
jgi:hypothetical protein